MKQTMNYLTLPLAAVMFWLSIIVLIFSAFPPINLVGSIHKWEQANDFPYGRMCNSIFTLYEDTCPKQVTKQVGKK